MKKLLICLFGLLFTTPLLAAVPAQYTELEYIESTGTQYIDTGYVMTDATGVKAEVDDTLSALVSGVASYFFGVQSTDGYQGYFIRQRSDLESIWAWNTEGLISTDNQSSHSIVSMNYKNDRKYIYNGTVAVQSLPTLQNTTLSLYLFAIHMRNGRMDYPASGKIYSVQITEESNTVRNFIPARRNSDNVIGMYDTVSGTFFTNAGTGSFIAGPIACDGTVVSGQWNQYVSNGNFSTENGWVSSGGTITAENNTLRFVKTADEQGVVYRTYNDFIVGNKYLITAQVKGPVATDNTFGAGGGAASSAAFSFSITNSNEYKTISSIVIPNSASNTTFYFYLKGGSAGAEFDIKNVMAFNLTQMFGAGNEPATAEEAERLIPVIASSLNISATDGYYATNTGQAYSYCVTGIKVATTKNVTAAFSGLNSQLTAAIATVNSVVTNTIDQANRIAALATGKQTRPTDTCPQYRQCLLVEGTDGTPHWYEINDPFYNFFAPILATNTNGTSSTDNPGYQQVEYIENTGDSYIDPQIVARGTKWEIVANTVSTSGEGLLVAFGPNAGRYVSTVDGAWSPGISSSFRGDATQKTLLTIDWTTSTTKVYIDNNFIGQVDVGNSGINENVFLLNFNNNYPFRGKLYSVHVTNASGNLIHNFIPVRRLSDSAVGMYDTVSKTFFANAGSGSFTAGPNVTNDSDVPSGPTWSVTWSNNGNSASGTVYGEGKCNNVSGTTNVAATSANLSSSAWNQSGAGCWCRATGLTSGGDTNTTDNGAWVFNSALSLAADCAYVCAARCAAYTRTYADFRSAVFTLSD